MVRWIALLLLLAGCSKPPPPPDLNVRLRRELTAFKLAAEHGMQYGEFRALRQSIDTELELRDSDLPANARLSGTKLRGMFLRIDYFWRQQVEVSYWRTAEDIDKMMMHGISPEMDRYLPSQMVSAALAEAVIDARKCLEELGSFNKPD